MTDLEQITIRAESDMSFSVAEPMFDWDTLSSEIHTVAMQTSVLASIICTPWNELAVASDYYDMIEGTSDPIFHFNTLHSISTFIRNSAEQLKTASYVPNITQLNTLFLNFKEDDLNNNQSSRDEVAEVKRNPNQSIIPFHPQEIYLYRRITQGANPWEVVKSFSDNLIEAIHINPQYTLTLIQTTGLDIILREFPAISTSELSDLGVIMNQWQSDDGQLKKRDGIEFFVEALRESGVSTQRDGESAADYLHRIFQLLPSVQKYVKYGLPPGQNQDPQYYLELLRGMSYQELQRRLQFGETYRETISALSVRNGEILAAASNPNKDMHADHLLIAITRQKLGDPTSLLDGVDVYVTCAPCKKKCWPELKELRLHALFTGPRTTEGISPLDELEVEYPVQTGLLAEELTQLFEVELQWGDFLEKNYSK